MNDIVRRHSESTFSRVVEHGGLVYIAGTNASNKAANCREQTVEVLGKIDKMLAEAGTSKSRILTATVWLADLREKDEMDIAWKAWADPANLPARACVEAKLSTPDTRVLIMLTAAK